MSLGSQPALPVNTACESTGLSVRQWYAALAMQAIVAKGLEVKADRVWSETEKERELATRAWRLADAMLQLESKVQPVA